MNYYGKDYNYARERLSNTIVSLSCGAPVYVKNVSLDGTVMYTTLDDWDLIKVTTLDKVDLTPIKLGWVNTPKGLLYTTRVPARKWKQGLSAESFHIVYRDEKAVINFPSPHLINTIKNFYPPLKEVLKYLTPQTKKAFSRNWAVSNERLMYNGRVVGVMSEGKASLQKRDAYLREFFQETTGADCGYC